MLYVIFLALHGLCYLAEAIVQLFRTGTHDGNRTEKHDPKKWDRIEQVIQLMQSGCLISIAIVISLGLSNVHHSP